MRKSDVAEVDKLLQVQEPFDPCQFRPDFPILRELFVSGDGKQQKPLVYLDNAATSQKPRQVIAAIQHYYEHQNANVHRGLYTLAERANEAYEQSRKKIARFIHAASEKEIVFTRGTTESINLVAAAYGRKFVHEGDEVIVSEMEHHSNLVPWQLLCQERKANLRYIPFATDGTLSLGWLGTLITPKTKLIAVTHVSNVFGTINPVAKIIAMAHSKNIPVLLDGAQSVAHLATDVQQLDCDFLAFSGHKMCGPTGIGVLYGKSKWLEAMDPYQSGGDMIGSVWLERSTWNELPYKFEAGTPDIAGAVGLGAAVTYLTEIGMVRIGDYEKKICDYALTRLAEVKDLQVIGNAPQRSGVISFCVAGIHPHDIAQFLDHCGIAIRAGHHCAQPLMRKLNLPATARVSFYFYNTLAEVDLLIAALQEMKEFFRHGL
jgi:cysteine desulfurase/selenocysteine lyase